MTGKRAAPGGTGPHTTTIALGLAAAVAIGIGSLVAFDVVGGPVDHSTRPADARADRTEARDRAETAISRLLTTRSTAVLDGDRKAFMAILSRTAHAGSDADWPRAQRRMFANLQRLPITTFGYRSSGSTYVPESAELNAGPVTIPVIEDVQFAGSDRRPVSQTIELTFVDGDDGWKLAAPPTTATSRPTEATLVRPWDGGPVRYARAGRLIVVVDRDSPVRPEALLARVRAQIRTSAGVLGTEPRSRLVVDATSSGTGVRLSEERKRRAIAVSIVGYYFPGADGPTRVAGHRIKYNPSRVDSLLQDDVLLRHELTHYLSGARIKYEPKWVSEGLAEYVSYHPTGPSGLVIAGSTYDRISRQPHRLPSSAEFGERPARDYLISQCAATYLIENFGMKRYTKFRTGFRESVGPDAADAQVRKRLRRVYGLGPRQLADRAWQVFKGFNRS
ncbi:MAG: hypothetical protein ACRCYQ_14655 [Nocardioides sp.]